MNTNKQTIFWEKIDLKIKSDGNGLSIGAKESQEYS